MKIRELYKYAALMGIIVIYSASGAIAEEVLPPTTCDCFDLNIRLVTDVDGNYPIESTCTDTAGLTVPCWKYEYLSDMGASAYGQTIPGLGPEGPDAFFVYPQPDSFSSITVSDPAVGTTINKACFGQNVYERRVINFVSAPSGNPPKFGYAVNQAGVGWTSLYFKQGNNVCSCPIAGPDFAETRYIKTAIKILFFGETRVRFEINYTNCTYRAFQEYPLDSTTGEEIELTQSPEAEITITVGDDSGPVRESQSPGECRELSAAYGTGTCSLYLLGGSYVRIPFNCTP